MFVYFDSFSWRRIKESRFGLILSSRNQQLTDLKWCDLQIKVSMYSCEQACLFSQVLFACIAAKWQPIHQKKLTYFYFGRQAFRTFNYKLECRTRGSGGMAETKGKIKPTSLLNQEVVLAKEIITCQKKICQTPDLIWLTFAFKGCQCQKGEKMYDA